MKTRALAVPLALALVAGCATHAVTLSTLHPPGGKRVTAEISKFSVLYLTPLPMEAATTLLERLKEQCGGAGVTGITTRTSSAWVVIGSIEKVEAAGYCEP